MMEQKSWAELAAEASSEDTRSFVRRVKRASRRKCTSEEKVRVVLEGFRGEIRVSELCQRDSIRRNSGGPGGIRTHDSRTETPDLCLESPTQECQDPPASLRDGVAIEQASPDDLPEKQESIARRSVAPGGWDCQSGRRGQAVL
jgi:transposase-like protein